jgi:peptidoglycan hydrolase-like protein with peptidoglycan-binding domain
MASYPRSAYNNPFNSLSSYGSASARGWGAGWPNCQYGKMMTVSGGGVRVTVRGEVAQMVAYLLEATDRVYNLKSGSTGAYNCRPIAGTSKASNHSWGLAVDINWNDNPYSYTFHSEIPPKVVKMWNDCGWYWGGFYGGRKDTMHFEYIGKPSDVAKHTAKAKEYANPTPKPSKPADNSKGHWHQWYKWRKGDRLRTIQRWWVGDDVAMLQRYLGLKDDGYFGPDTEKAVKRYQMSQDLKADGIVGPKTWGKITRYLDVK